MIKQMPWSPAFFVPLCLGVFVFNLALLNLSAQDLVVDAGVRGGVFAQPPPVEASSNHYFPPSFTVNRTLFDVGPSISALLYNKVEIRLEGVRSRFEFNSNSVEGPTSFTSVTKGYIWQFPFLATYQFASGSVRPFAGGGISLATKVGGSTEGTEIEQIPGAPSRTSSLNGPYRTFSNPLIFYISGGVNAGTSRFSIRPELRYARWSPFSDQENATLNSRNQLEFVIGFSVHVIRAN
jgi:hypothetical protein